MKCRNFVFSLFVGITALFIGLAAVGVYQFFFGNSDQATYSNLKTVEKVDFDINDPNSVLPLDYEEDKLTSPSVDETNEAYFDPEGHYHFLSEPPVDFEEFFYIAINNKNFDVEATDPKYGELTTPRGHAILQTENNQVQYLDFDKLSIGNGKIQFETETANGIKYEFDGEFLVKGNFYTLDEDTEVLKGTFVKSKNGKQIAKSDVNLGWNLEIGCLH